VTPRELSLDSTSTGQLQLRWLERFLSQHDVGSSHSLQRSELRHNSFPDVAQRGGANGKLGTRADPAQLTRVISGTADSCRGDRSPIVAVRPLALPENGSVTHDASSYCEKTIEQKATKGTKKPIDQTSLPLFPSVHQRQVARRTVALSRKTSDFLKGLMDNAHFTLTSKTIFLRLSVRGESCLVCSRPFAPTKNVAEIPAIAVKCCAAKHSSPA
jgi:hypothetical protein